MMKFFMFFSFFVDGFAYAGEALVGKEVGLTSNSEAISQRSGLTSIVHSLFNWAIGVGLVFTLIYAVWGNECVAAMTDDAEVLAASTRYLIWLIAMPLVSTLAFMWDGVYVGLTAGKQIRNSMVWAAVGFMLGYLLTYRWLGMQALYIAYFAHLFARACYLTLEWKKIEK